MSLTAIDVRNVHQALPEGCHRMRQHGARRESRNGPVEMLPGPCVTTYRVPLERVVFHPERDANPYFHLLESIWMLHGRNDVEWISEFNSNISQFSDDGQIFNGAYGFRWRRHFGKDQLLEVIENLKRSPHCRRQVIGMWDASKDLGAKTNDVPCNVIATTQIDISGRLELMVSNRSNDLIWGAYGANAVHFSVLQEFIAHGLRVPMGEYHQVSANTHVYERHFMLVQKLANEAPMPPAGHTCPYSFGIVEATPLFSPKESLTSWLEDLDSFMAGRPRDYDHRPFCYLECLQHSWRAFKTKRSNRFDSARRHLEFLPEKSDWRTACWEWLDRREEKA